MNYILLGIMPAYWRVQNRFTKTVFLDNVWFSTLHNDSNHKSRSFSVVSSFRWNDTCEKQATFTDGCIKSRYYTPVYKHSDTFSSREYHDIRSSTDDCDEFPSTHLLPRHQRFMLLYFLDVGASFLSSLKFDLLHFADGIPDKIWCTKRLIDLLWTKL